MNEPDLVKTGIGRGNVLRLTAREQERLAAAIRPRCPAQADAPAAQREEPGAGEQRARRRAYYRVDVYPTREHLHIGGH